MARHPTRTVRVVLAAALLPLLLTTGAGAGAPAEGPALVEDPAALDAALDCPEGLTHFDRPIVLLVHGTATTAEESWPDGLGKVLPGAGFDWCTVQLPGRALVDIQTSSEYVVAAVRSLHERSGRKVSLVGHSQGAHQIRWAVRWWPDVRAVVKDLVSVAGSNRGLPYLSAQSCAFGCAPALWQQASGSAFIAAQNEVPIVKGPAYTSVYSLTDDLVQPALPAERAVATIDGAANIAVQDICPGRPVGHVQAVYDAAVTAVILDAFAHAGPANPARVDRAACFMTTPPGVDPGVAAARITAVYANGVRAVAAGPKTGAEPPLRPYVTDR